MSAVSWADLFRVFGRIGVLSFGGPAAQIALMHQELVEKRPWLSEDGYLRALSLCMLLPGPEAMQLATYAGWRMRGTLGGLLAGGLFVLPGAFVIALLAVGYAYYGQLPLVQAAFLGVKAAVVIIVFQALSNMSGKALQGAAGWVLAILSFLAVFAIGLPFPLIILAAALYGMAMHDKAAPRVQTPTPRPSQTFGTFAIWGGLWAMPLLIVWAIDQQFLLQLGLFFSKLAVVTFGGAYAVLAYMTQTVVQDYGWISTQQMIDALGLAETTPGPLILVTEFVALLAGHAQTGLTGAISAGVMALWVTFIPCFLWIFIAGPYLDRIAAQPRLAAALDAIKSAVVGVIANLSLWFALHVLFVDVSTGVLFALPVPNPATFDLKAGLLMLVAVLVMLVFKRGLFSTILLMAGLGLIFALF